MSWGQKPLCLIHFWVIPFLPLSSPAPFFLPLSGIGPPSMKGKKLESFWNKIRLTGCIWSSLNALGSETPVSHLLLGDSIFAIFFPCSFLPSWGNKELDLPVWKVKILEQNQLNRLQMVQYECSKVTHQLVFSLVSFVGTYPLLCPNVLRKTLTSNIEDAATWFSYSATITVHILDMERGFHVN